MFKMACRHFGARTVTPKEICSSPAFYCPPCILIQNKTRKFLPSYNRSVIPDYWFGAGDIGQSPLGKQPIIKGYGSSGGDGHIDVPQGTFFQKTKKLPARKPSYLRNIQWLKESWKDTSIQKLISKEILKGREASLSSSNLNRSLKGF